MFPTKTVTEGPFDDIFGGGPRGRATKGWRGRIGGAPTICGGIGGGGTPLNTGGGCGGIAPIIPGGGLGINDIVFKGAENF